MLLGTFNKQPSEVYDYDFDYSEWLTTKDNVASCVVKVFPDDGADPQGLQIETVTVMDPIVKIWVSGGVDRTTYKITLTTTTEDGRIKEDEIKIKVKDI